MIPEKLPKEIIDEILGSEQPIIIHLEGYKKSGLNWDEYASKKIDATLREKLRRAFREIRRNGFVFPVIDYTQAEPRLLWHQAVEQYHGDNPTNRSWPPVPADLCSMCESKNCRLKNSVKPQDCTYKPCWQRNLKYMARLRDLGRIEEKR